MLGLNLINANKRGPWNFSHAEYWFEKQREVQSNANQTALIFF